MTTKQLPLNHYIPPQNWEPFTTEFVIPTPESYFIWWLFKHKCIICRKPASEINEIIPRSRSKKSILDWKNRVTLCQNCHQEYHAHGVTQDKISEMKEKRKEFLISIDREIYVDYYPEDSWQEKPQPIQITT